MNLDRLDDLPQDGEFMIIVSMDSVYVPGDERSRTAPGHGYPAHTVNHPRIQYFTDAIEWKNAIKKLAVPAFGQPKDLRAFIVTPVGVETSVDVKVGDR